MPQHYGCQQPEEVIADLGKYEEKLKELMLFAPEPSSQLKYQYTINWIDYVSQKFDNVFVYNPFWRDSGKVK
ncbi:MAG: hypothetical protein PHQ86_03940 [Dehalococcoidales bacterium]|nr:hypothetical protein [Dehalococcoidales bacterium]